MNKFSFLTQIGMIGIAIAIVVMYIEPKISSIRDTQDLITSYETETQNVSQVNESLKAKIAAIESVTPEDSQALARFMPSKIDEISVLKDLGVMLESQSISEYDIAYKGNNAVQTSEDEAPNEYGAVNEHYFSVGFEAEYSQVKAFLEQLEINDYLLQVTNLKITDSEENLVKVEMSLTAFTLAQATEVITP
jgi:ribosomal protein S6